MAAAGSERARLFIAVPVPAAIRDALTEARRAFEAAGAPPLRWVRADGIHLTLKFLGETPLSRRAEIETAMAEAAARTLVHRLRLDGFGLFGGRRPHTLWAGLEGDVAQLRALAARLDRHLGQLGFSLENTPLTPHLTIARVPSRTDARTGRMLQRAVEDLAALPPPLPLLVETLQLIRSDLRRDGARYTVLAITKCRG